MEFWDLLNKAIGYYERGMWDYAEKCFGEAKAAREDAEYLISVIYATRNFKSMFTCSNDENTSAVFDAYFNTISNTAALGDSGKIKKDICEYILGRMADLKTMFLKSVALDIVCLTGRQADSDRTVKIYDDFKDYLRINRQKLLNLFKNAGVSLTGRDIDLLTAWCYVILLGDYEESGDVDHGYVARTDGVQWDATFSSAKTRIERDVRTVTYHMPRLGLVYIPEEEYIREYRKEFRAVLQKCGIPEKKVVSFQKEFSQQVFVYDTNNYRQYLSYEPFVNENIWGNKSVNKSVLMYFIPVVGPVYFAGKIIKHCFNEVIGFVRGLFDTFK